ncbi:MAG TPA: hypothetical protein PL100_01205 [Bacillota bacterium]|nr:hypothetical protein [Bacillota bacterium]HQC48133.1 hypothetical protein [Bacillota bacterium]
MRHDSVTLHRYETSTLASGLIAGLMNVAISRGSVGCHRRREAILILSQSIGGYFFPSEGDKEGEKAERYIKMMKRQVQERLETVALTEDWLAERRRVVVKQFTSS